ncbi:MAG TPA: HD domain-containing protein [Azospirillum sp.]|nr:HD domain-containing protein [Azospirillum sp.]
MNPLVQFAVALDFAAAKHTDHRRKGVRGEPYVNHLIEVARLVAEATDGQDPEAVVAAVLHDTLEDTDATREELEEHFGAEIASIVAEVTDDKRLTKDERKQRQVDSAPDASHRAKLVKLADKISNLRSMQTSPPAHWRLERKVEYFEWAARVVEGLRGINAGLEAQFDAAHRDGLDQLRGKKS